MGVRTRAREGGSRGFGSGGVGGRGTGPKFRNLKRSFLKDALWGGGVTHRSWPGGQGGKLRALVAGEGWGSSKKGGGLGPNTRRGGRQFQRKGETLERRPLHPPLGPRLGLGEGVQGLRCRGGARARRSKRKGRVGSKGGLWTHP